MHRKTGGRPQTLTGKLLREEGLPRAGTDVSIMPLLEAQESSPQVQVSKQTTQMGKLKKSYSERVGVPVKSLMWASNGCSLFYYVVL